MEFILNKIYKELGVKNIDIHKETGILNSALSKISKDSKKSSNATTMALYSYYQKHIGNFCNLNGSINKKLIDQNIIHNNGNIKSKSFLGHFCRIHLISTNESSYLYSYYEDEDIDNLNFQKQFPKWNMLVFKCISEEMIIEKVDEMRDSGYFETIFDQPVEIDEIYIEDFEQFYQQKSSYVECNICISCNHYQMSDISLPSKSITLRFDINSDGDDELTLYKRKRRRKTIY